MNIAILNFTIVNSPNTKYSDAQVLLEEFTGKKFVRDEADAVWANVLKHKWNISEKLDRDVGFRVAAIDFMENFYQKNQPQTTKLTVREIKIPAFLRSAIRFYFESKAASINF
jgi:hypothetical protein